MIKINSESKIDINKLDYSINDELPNELLLKTLKCRQNIVKEFNKNDENYKGVIRTKDFIKKLIEGQTVEFKLPELLTDKYVPNDKIPQLEMEVIKEFEKVLKTKLKIIK